MRIKKDSSIWLLFVLLLGLAIHMSEHMEYRKKINNYHQVTKAYVTKVCQTNPNMAITTFVSYRYEIDDKEYKSEEILSVGLNYRPFLKVGDSIPLFYNADQPTNVTAISAIDFLPTYVIVAAFAIVLVVINFEKK